MNLPQLVDADALKQAESALEAALVAEGWRVAHREPFPPIQFQDWGEGAYATIWHCSKPTDTDYGPIKCRFEVGHDMLIDQPDQAVKYTIDMAMAQYDQLIAEGAPAQ